MCWIPKFDRSNYYFSSFFAGVRRHEIMGRMILNEFKKGNYVKNFFLWKMLRTT